MTTFCRHICLLLLGIELCAAFNRSFLIENILANYSIDTRPVVNVEDVLRINVTTGLNQIVFLDQKTNLVKISAYITMAWNDAFLQWQPEHFRNQKMVFLPYSKIWMPEIYLYYSVDGKLAQAHVHGSSMEAQVMNTGHIRAYIPFTSDSLCPVDVKYFPFDRQECTLQFGAWAHSTDTLVFDSPGAPNVNTKEFYDNQEWVLKNATMSAELINRTEFGTTQQFSVIKLRLIIQRQSFYYVFNLILPSTLITIVSLIGFHFPAASWGYRKAKFRLGITTLLSMSVLILTVATDLPKFSYQKVEGNRGSFSSVPIIDCCRTVAVIYYIKLLCFISFGTCTSSIPVFIERTIIMNKSPFPQCLLFTVWPMTAGACGQNSSKLGSTRTYNGSVSVRLLETAVDDESQEGVAGTLNPSIVNDVNREGLRVVIGAIADLRRVLKDIRRIALQHAPDDAWKRDEVLWQVFLFRFEIFSLFVYLILAFTAILMFFFRDWY